MFNMSYLLIVLLGFMGMVNGLEKLSAMDYRKNPYITGLFLSAMLQTAGSTMSILCTYIGDFKIPLILILAAIVAWAFSDRRELTRQDRKGASNGC